MSSSIQCTSSGFWGIPAGELKEALSSGQIKTIFKDIKVTTTDEQFIELEQFFLRVNEFGLEEKTVIFERIQKLSKKNQELANKIELIKLLLSIGDDDDEFSLFINHDENKEKALKFAEQLASKNAPEEEKIHFLQQLLLSRKFDLGSLFGEPDLIYQALKLKDESKEKLINFVIKENKEIHTFNHFLRNSFSYDTWLSSEMMNLYKNGKIDSVKYHFYNLLEFSYRDLCSPFCTFIASDDFKKMISELVSIQDEWVFRFTLRMLEKQNTTCPYLLKEVLAPTQFSLSEFLNFVRENSNSYDDIVSHMKSHCGMAVALSFPIKYNESLENRLLIAQKCLSENQELMSRHFSYFFSDHEIARDLGVNGPISQMIEECLGKISGEDKTYLLFSTMYYKRLLSEQTTPVDSSLRAEISSESQLKIIPPGDAHLYLYLGEEPGKENRGNHVFMVRREYDYEVGTTFRSQNTIEIQNAKEVSDKIAPAIEPTPRELFFKETPYFNNSIYSKLGFKVCSGPSGSFVVLPDPSVQEMRWSELTQFPEFSDLPKTISFPRVRGIASSRDFVKYLQEHDAGVSTDIEYFHDLTIHVHRIIVMMLYPADYVRVRKKVKELTEQILNVCDYILSQSPSQQDRDLVAFFEETAGIFYDRGTSHRSVQDWELEIDNWMKVIPFDRYWGLEYDYWRKGIRSRVPNDQDYSPEKIAAFWLTKKQAYEAQQAL
jgi:hypothetical protein